MGRTKALLPLPGGDCFLLRLDGTLRAAGITQVVAVTGRDSAAISAAVEGHEARGLPRLRLVENPDPSRGQLSSLLVGLDALSRAGVSPADPGVSPADSGVPPAVLVTTVDLPLVSVDTVRRVLAAWQTSRAPIVRPARGGRHGHPVIFGAALFAELHTADPRVGARAVTRAHASEIVDVPVDDAGAFDDIDTPEDYSRAVDRKP